MSYLLVLQALKKAGFTTFLASSISTLITAQQLAETALAYDIFSDTYTVNLTTGVVKSVINGTLTTIGTAT